VIEALLLDLRPLALVSLAGVAILACAESVRRLFGPAAEWTRKLVHVLMGLLSALLPFIFHSVWPVLVVCAAFALVLGLSMLLGRMRAVHGVSRASGGVIYYPLAVALLFALTAKEPGYYVACILVLTICDTAAALVGGAYGRLKFRVQGDLKSVEGSASFLLTAFVCVHVSLLLQTSLGRAECVLIALNVAVLVTLFEALSIRGIDNLVVPYGTLFILQRASDETPAALAKQLLILLSVALAMFLLSRLPKTLLSSAVLAVSLMAYGAWALEDFTWFLSVALVVVWFCLLWSVPGRDLGPAEFELREVFHVFLVPFLILWAANAWQLSVALFFPFLAALGTAFGFITYAWLGMVLPQQLAAGRAWPAVWACGATLGLVLVPAAAVHGGWDTWTASLIVLSNVVTVGAYVGVFERWVTGLTHFLRVLLLFEGLSAALVLGGQSLMR
jgi:dolichol kinase